MATQVTLTIPDKLYSRARQLAELRQQSIQTVLVSELAHLITPDETAQDQLRLGQDLLVAREKQAYHAMHPQLWQQYPGQHVAIYGGELVDHDADGAALSRRIYARYPHDFVLIKKVEPQPERVLRFRSPRFVKKENSKS